MTENARREAALLWGGITAGVIAGAAFGWWALLLSGSIGLLLALEVTGGR
jgi:hypothetical protein